MLARKLSIAQAYHCVDFVPDGPFGIFDGLASADQSDLALAIRSRWLRHVDLAAGRVLHLLDRFSAYVLCEWSG